MKTITDAAQEILNGLNAWLSSNQTRLTFGNTLFALDSDVEYQGPVRRIHASKLAPPDQFRAVLTDLIAGGPSWLHANLLPLPERRFLVTVVAGTRVGSPHPSINFSHELDRVVEVLDYQR